MFKQCKDTCCRTFLSGTREKKNKKNDEKGTSEVSFQGQFGFTKASLQYFQLYLISVRWAGGVDQYETQASVAVWSEIVS